MQAFGFLDIRPYQLLCLICREGRTSLEAPYPHEARLDEIREALRADPILPLTLRCNTDTVFRYQNPGRAFDTPGGPLYNDLRDLTILQRLGAVPGSTRPAIDWLEGIFETIPSVRNVCGYAESEAPGWPRCRWAVSGHYERAAAQGPSLLVPVRAESERVRTKQTSAEACRPGARLRIRPHHLLCMTCFHGGRPEKDIQPIPQDNLCEAIRAMQQDPGIEVELIHGPCMICPPCGHYHPGVNLCIGGKSMGLRDDRKDLDTLRRMGLRYGDILPARELLNRLYAAVESTTFICGFGDGVARGRAWRVCGGPEGHAGYARGRRAGLGVPGVVSSHASREKPEGGNT